VAVSPVRPSSVDFGQPPQALRVDQFRGPLELVEVLLQSGVRQLGQGLEPQRLDRGPQLRSGPLLLEHVFGC
jgi:hypothetical protein